MFCFFYLYRRGSTKIRRSFKKEKKDEEKKEEEEKNVLHQVQNILDIGSIIFTHTHTAFFYFFISNNSIFSSFLSFFIHTARCGGMSHFSFYIYDIDVAVCTCTCTRNLCHIWRLSFLTYMYIYIYIYIYIKSFEVFLQFLYV